jgi:hypothetical protein
MLATPLSGRFIGENRKLVFAPPEWYFWLIYATGIAALVFLGFGLGAFRSESFLLNNPPVCMLTGALLALAALFAFVSLERITFDLRERIYRRWFGRSFLPGYAHGRLDELESIVVMAQELPFSPKYPGRTGVYRIVMVWKGGKLPLLVGEESYAPLGVQPLAAGAAPTLQRAASFGRALGVPVYDQTAVSSGHPVPFL